MQGFVLVLALAALPAAGNFLGGLAAEVFKVSERALSLALHLAAGIVLAVVGLELMPEALTAQPPWVPVLAFAAGGVLFMGIERVIGFVQSRLKMGKSSAGPLAIFSGVSMDLFSDGVMIGTATVLNPSLGLLLALGQVPADIPEGFAAVASLRRANMRRRTRVLMALSFTIPILLGATLGYFALRDAPRHHHPLRARHDRWGTDECRRRRNDVRGSRRRNQPFRPPLPHRRLRALRPHLGRCCCKVGRRAAKTQFLIP